ncbi:MAG: hypothetical protein WBL93_02085 [Lutisporaceae bacterium]
MQKTQSKGVNKPNNKDVTSEIKKGKKKNTFKLVLIIIFLTVIIAFGAIFMFNIGGLRQNIAKSMSGIPIIGKLVQPVIENKTTEEIEQEMKELEKKDLEIKQQQLNEKAKELDKKEKELQAKEQELATKEADINSQTLQLSEKITSVQEQVEYFEKIETSKAVQILLSMNEKESVVQILRNMKKDKAAQILSIMDPLQAAQLLEDISQKEASDITAQQ